MFLPTDIDKSLSLCNIRLVSFIQATRRSGMLGTNHERDGADEVDVIALPEGFEDQLSDESPFILDFVEPVMSAPEGMASTVRSTSSNEVLDWEND